MFLKITIYYFIIVQLNSLKLKDIMINSY